MLSRFALQSGNFATNKNIQTAQTHSIQIAARMAGQESAGCIIKAAEKRLHAVTSANGFNP